MLDELIKQLLIFGVLCGLCASMPTNTSAAEGTPGIGRTSATVSAPEPVRPPIAAESVKPPGAAEPVKPPGAAAQMKFLPKTPGIARIALLLPLRSDTLSTAANAIKSGFMAAYERERDGFVINVIETSDTASEVAAIYSDVLAQHELVVGPLSRSGVTAIAHGVNISKPTIALNQPEPRTMAGGGDSPLPAKLLVMGLSIEEEARQVATWAGNDKPAGKAFVVSANVAWQRRAAKAFAGQWQRMGMEVQAMELAVNEGYLNVAGLVQLKARLQNEKPSLIFVALNADQTRQLRSTIGREIALYGTSQLNALALSDQELTDSDPEMEGVRLLDLPWLLQADHMAVMVYPKPVASAEQKRSADLERLYALGIDAYRVARQVGLNEARESGDARNSAKTAILRNSENPPGQFEIDGVTGKLSINFGKDSARFERVEMQAVYQDGVPTPLVNAR